LKYERIALLALAVTPVVVIIACGGSTDDIGATPTPSATVTTPTATNTGSSKPAPTATTPTDAGLDSSDSASAIDAADAADAAPATFTISGTIVNAANTGLVIQNNLANDITVAPATATFSFSTKIATGSPYAVTIKTLPNQQACKVTGGSGTVAGANVTGVVVDCGNRTACKGIKTDIAGTVTGTYLIDPDGAAGAITPFAAYCDMTFDDGNGGGAGGWTLIESTSGKLGPDALAEGLVAPGSAAYLPLATMISLANGASQVHIRSTGLAATESVTSKANMEPITNLRLGAVVNTGLEGLTPAEQVDRWTGIFAIADRLSFGCATNSQAWPGVYWACGNGSGLHLVTNNSRWDWQGGDTTQNLDLEVYVR
jgi:hypothetical protein